MATQADIRERVRDYLFGAAQTERPFVTQLGASYTTGTTITVADGTMWKAGDILENLDTGESMYVVSIATNVLTVIRAWGGSTQASSSGSDDTLYKNPRWTTTSIDRAISLVVRSLEGWGVHTWGTGTITLVANEYGYDLADTDILESVGVVAVYYLDDTTKTPVGLPFTQRSQIKTSGADTADTVVILHGVGDRVAGDSIDYTYAARIEDVTGLRSRQEDLVVLGAAAQCLGMDIAPRTTDPGRYTDRTIQAGQEARDARWFQSEFFVRIRAEAATLATERQRMFPGTVAVHRARRWRA